MGIHTSPRLRFTLVLQKLVEPNWLPDIIESSCARLRVFGGSVLRWRMTWCAPSHLMICHGAFFFLSKVCVSTGSQLVLLVNWKVDVRWSLGSGSWLLQCGVSPHRYTPSVPICKYLEHSNLRNSGEIKLRVPSSCSDISRAPDSGACKED
jgi:hypothetical protein